MLLLPLYVSLNTGCMLFDSLDPATDKSGSEGSTDGDDGNDDGDGDTDNDEEDNTDDLDDDGDGLTNGEEADLGTDKDNVDSDGDTYSDYDEVQTGHDPTDADDAIYEGGWPYNPNKDDLEDPGWDSKDKVGNMVPRFVSYDYNEDDFELYDFAGHGKPVIIDISAEWCSYCQELAKFMGGQNSYFDDYEASYPELGAVRDGIANGDLYWIEIIDQNESGTTVDAKDLQQWEKKYGIPGAPVVADEDQLWLNWTDLVGYPTLLVVDENMEIISYSKRDYFEALAGAADAI